MVHKAKVFGGHHNCEWAFPSGSGSKESACNADSLIFELGEDPLEKGMVTHPLQYSYWGNPRDRGTGKRLE